MYNFRKSLLNLKNSSDFTDYIKLLKVCLKMVQYSVNYDLRSPLTKLRFAYYKFVDRPEIFNNSDQLKEVDQLHIELYEKDPFELIIPSLLATRDEYK